MYEKILHLNFCGLLLSQNPKTLYSEHLVTEDTFLGTQVSAINGFDCKHFTFVKKVKRVFQLKDFIQELPKYKLLYIALQYISLRKEAHEIFLLIGFTHWYHKG